MPEGSIASGYRLEIDQDGRAGLGFSHPSIEQLRREFLRKRKGR